MPSVHPAGRATPSAPVVAVAPATLPPPLTTAKVTVAPGTAFPYWSRTTTAGAAATAAPTAADRSFAARLAIVAAAPGVAVAVKRTVGRPAAVASTVCGPAVVP